MNLRRIAASLTSLAVTATGGALFLATPAHATAWEGKCRYSWDGQPYLSIGDTDASTSQYDGDRPVSQAQCELNSVLDRYVAHDGIFGNGTFDAVVAFQTCAGISEDGIIGPNTWDKLDYWFDHRIDCHR